MQVISEEDRVIKRFSTIQPLEVAEKLGILHQIFIEDSFYDITTEKIAERVLANHEIYEQKVAKKKKS